MPSGSELRPAFSSLQGSSSCWSRAIHNGPEEWPGAGRPAGSHSQGSLLHSACTTGPSTVREALRADSLQDCHLGQLFGDLSEEGSREQHCKTEEAVQAGAAPQAPDHGSQVGMLSLLPMRGCRPGLTRVAQSAKMD